MPEDIPPAKYVSVFLGVCLLGAAAMAFAPVFYALRFDGFSRVPNWSGSMWSFFLVGSVFLGFGLWFVFSPKRMGAQAAFHEGGFTLRVRRFIGKEQCHRIDWTDVEEMKLVEAPSGQDVITFLLIREAALREGMIEPTTTASAIAARTVAFPIRLAFLTPSDAVDRFIASAEHAGARLVQKANFNVVIVLRKVWAVEWP